MTKVKTHRARYMAGSVMIEGQGGRHMAGLGSMMIKEQEARHMARSVMIEGARAKYGRVCDDITAMGKTQDRSVMIEGQGARHMANSVMI